MFHVMIIEIEDTKIVYYSNNLNEADHVLPSYKLGDYLAKRVLIFQHLIY